MMTNKIQTQWQPISTAPRDGTHILLLYRKKGATVRGNVGRFITQGCGYDWGWEDYTKRLISSCRIGEEVKRGKNEVTHWMPLPGLIE